MRYLSTLNLIDMEVKDLNLIEMEVKENTCQRRIYGIFKYMRIDPSVPDKLDKIGLKTMQRLTESGCISRGSEEELPKSSQTEAWTLLSLHLWILPSS